VGTSNPVMMRDTDFGMVRLRAFGIYSMRVADPRELINRSPARTPTLSPTTSKASFAAPGERLFGRPW
jgi:hypothetical protein